MRIVAVTVFAAGVAYCAGFSTPSSVNNDKSTGYDSEEPYARTLKKNNGLFHRIFAGSHVDVGSASYHQRMRQNEASAFSNMMLGKNRFLIFPVRKIKKPGNLILLRHGESQGASQQIFTGWSDVDLTDRGFLEVEHAARLIRESGYDIDVIFTSRLKRAIHSTWALMRELDETYLPVFKSWRLNERSYGSLTGLSKAEVANLMGESVVQNWRTDPYAVPPAMNPDDPRWPGRDRKFADLAPEQIPATESLVECMARVKPLWEDKIKSELENGHNVLVVGHGSTLRGLVKHIQGGMSDEEAQKVKVPPGSPIVYEFNRNMGIKPTKDELSISEGLYGKYLDKPGLLQLALERESEWKARYGLGAKCLAFRSGYPL
jgi:2,3-bisphosphoglycerate-dependent phosphoglycerate mutase